MERRQMLKFSIAAAAAGELASTGLRAQQGGAIGGMQAQPGAQKRTDTEPQVNDIEKYPSCNYCGMDRMKFHHSRMLIDYMQDVADPVCSLRCAASSLTIKLGRGPKAIWVGDNASDADIKPLTNAEKATFLVGSQIKGVMTRRSKVAYSSKESAEAAQKANGGEVVDFDKALLAAYTDISESVSMNLKTRDERLKRTQQQKQLP